jgi:hypothetical protein
MPSLGRVKAAAVAVAAALGAKGASLLRKKSSTEPSGLRHGPLKNFWTVRESSQGGGEELPSYEVMAAAVDESVSRPRLGSGCKRWRPSSAKQQVGSVPRGPDSLHASACAQAAFHKLDHSINEAFELIGDAARQESSIFYPSAYPISGMASLDQEEPSAEAPTLPEQCMRPLGSAKHSELEQLSPAGVSGNADVNAYPLSIGSLCSCISSSGQNAAVAHPLSARALESCISSTYLPRGASLASLSPASSSMHPFEICLPGMQQSVPDLAPPPSDKMYASGYTQHSGNLLSAFCSSSSARCCPSADGESMASCQLPQRAELRLDRDAPAAPSACLEGKPADLMPSTDLLAPYREGYPSLHSEPPVLFNAAAAAEAASAAPLEFVASLASSCGSSAADMASDASDDSLGFRPPMSMLFNNCLSQDVIPKGHLRRPQACQAPAQPTEHLGLGKTAWQPSQSYSAPRQAERATERLLSQTAAMLFEALPNDSLLQSCEEGRPACEDACRLPQPQAPRVRDNAIVCARTGVCARTWAQRNISAGCCDLERLRDLRSGSGRPSKAAAPLCKQRLPEGIAVRSASLMEPAMEIDAWVDSTRERRASSGAVGLGGSRSSWGLASRPAAFAAELARRDFLQEAREQLGIAGGTSDEDSDCCSSSSSCISSEVSVVVVVGTGGAEEGRPLLVGPEGILVEAAAKMATVPASSSDTTCHRKPLLTVSSDVAAAAVPDPAGPTTSAPVRRAPDPEQAICAATTGATAASGPPNACHAAAAATLPAAHRAWNRMRGGGHAASKKVAAASSAMEICRRRRSSDGAAEVRSPPASRPAAAKRPRQPGNGAERGPTLLVKVAGDEHGGAVGAAMETWPTAARVKAASLVATKGCAIAESTFLATNANACCQSPDTGSPTCSHKPAYTNVVSSQEAFLGSKSQHRCEGEGDSMTCGAPTRLSQRVRLFQPPPRMSGGQEITPRSQRHVFRPEEDSANIAAAPVECFALGDKVQQLAAQRPFFQQPESAASCPQVPKPSPAPVGGTMAGGSASSWLQPGAACIVTVQQ